MGEESRAESEAMDTIARAIRLLGNADAATPMGGLEALGAVIKEGDYNIAGAIESLADAIRDVAAALVREDREP